MSIRVPSLELLRALRYAAQPHLHPHRHTFPTHTAPYLPISAPTRHLSSTPSLLTQQKSKGRTPTTHDRGPASTEDTQTDFSALDVLRNTTTPATAIDACTTDGFHFNNGLRTTGGSGVLLLGGETFTWRPWGAASSSTISSLLSKTGILNVAPESMSVLSVLYPLPDLLIIGTGARLWMLSPETRRHLESLGIRVEMQDTANAASTYNLLATERGVEGVGAALLPVGWKGNAKR